MDLTCPEDQFSIILRTNDPFRIGPSTHNRAAPRADPIQTWVISFSGAVSLR
jgi:hypothetical protein